MLSKERAVHWDPDKARAIALELKELEGPLIPILHALNDRFGHISDEAMVIVATCSTSRGRKCKAWSDSITISAASRPGAT